MRGHRFGDVEVDVERREIRRQGQVVTVDRQVFDLIAYLAGNGDRVVTRSELLDEVWGDRFVSESALSTQIKHARRALGDDGQRQSRIVTVRGVGYRMILAVSVSDLDPIGRGGLPAPFEDLIGREQELASVARLVEADAAVTLVGPGGVGKTRLAIESARRLSDRFGDGVRLVELAPVTGDDDVAPATADVIGVRAAPTEPLLSALCRSLAGRQLLLAIDNCEHVPDGVLDLITTLRARCPTVMVLATSRSPIGFDGEHLVSVPPLATRSTATGPPTDAEALLLRRLGAVDPQGEWKPELVAAVCHRLDGIPLAVELAAGRVRTLGLEELAARLDQAIELLGAKRATERHRTLRDTIGWSYDLLPPRHQRLLRRASVFAGPFTLASAEAVLPDQDLAPADVAAGLAALADASLLQLVNDATGGRRFRMLETIGQFGRDAADPDDLAKTTARFVAHTVRWAKTAIDGYLGANPGLWSTLIDIELDNVREAARRAIDDKDYESVIQIAVHLFHWVGFNPIDDPMLWAEAIVDDIEDDDLLRARTLALASGRAASLGGDRDQMISELEATMDGPAASDAFVVTCLALLHWFHGNATTAIEYNRRTAELWEADGEHALAQIARSGESMAADAVDRSEAHRLASAVFEAGERMQSPLLRAQGLLCLAGTQAHDDKEAALASATELVGVARTLGSRFHLGSGLRIRSHMLSRLHRSDEADASYRETLEINGIGDRGELLWYTVLNLIEHFIRRGRDEDAAVALSAYLRSPSAIKDNLVRRALDRAENGLADRLGATQLDFANARAERLSQAELLRYLDQALVSPRSKAQGV